eukprot:6190833-Pleurochrysis_carterae.AAC.4
MVLELCGCVLDVTAKRDQVVCCDAFGSGDSEVLTLDNNAEDEEDQDLDLMYDPILNCYYEPKTNKYYELA